jgi:membrane fusion protein (multidrug efflux system)
LAASFPRTLRSLRVDGSRSVVTALAVAALLLLAWAAWFTLGTVRVFERSETARIEVAGAPQAIQTPVAGTVLRADLALGRVVQAGEVLVELDAKAEALALQEAQRQQDASAAQQEFLRAELAATEAATRDDQMAARAALAEARAKRREAEARRALATEEASGIAKLSQGGNIGDIERLRANTEAQSREASAEATAVGETRLDWAQRTSTSDRLAAIARLRREVARVEGEEKVNASTIEKLSHEIERRKLRSPVAGRIGEVVVLREGSVVREGDRVATVVPSGELRVVAEFAQATVGRLRRGQEARVRLTSFNWAEFGTLTASVISVATEPQGGRIRAELRLTAPPPPGIPLQHGLAGDVDVEVERTSPAALVLRAAGRSLGRAAPPEPAEEPTMIGRRP